MFPVERMCKVFKVSKSGYYASLKRPQSKRGQQNQEILSLIRHEHKKSKQRYGSPRICKALKDNQVHVSRPRVARLMRQAQIRAKMKRRFKATTDSRHNFAVIENLLDRNFTAAITGQAWVSDITAWAGPLYQNLSWLALPYGGAGFSR